MVPMKGKALKMKKPRENDGNYAGGERGVAQRLLKSLCCMPETHGTPCINYTSKLNPGQEGAWG